MKINPIVYLIIGMLFISSCTENDEAIKPNTSIDVKEQWMFDPNGVLIKSHPDGQWVAKNFTSSELDLFKSLDTTSLVGTTSPFSVVLAPLNYCSIYPNSFNHSFNISFNFITNYSGPFVMKYVVVDSLSNPIEKLSARAFAIVNQAQGLPSVSTISFLPNIPKGKYRLYFTLSSQVDPHFYQSWGNIEKE